MITPEEIAFCSSPPSEDELRDFRVALEPRKLVGMLIGMNRFVRMLLHRTDVLHLENKELKERIQQLEDDSPISENDE